MRLYGGWIKNYQRVRKELGKTFLLIKNIQNAANRRHYAQEQLNRFLGKKNIRTVVAYTRVSSRNQQDDLHNQMDFIINFANSHGVIIDEHIEETGSGLNYKRKKWNKLLQEVEDREID